MHHFKWKLHICDNKIELYQLNIINEKTKKNHKYFTIKHMPVLILADGKESCQWSPDMEESRHAMFW